MKKALWIIGLICIIIAIIPMVYLSVKYWRLFNLALFIEHYNVVVPCFISATIGVILTKANEA